MGGEPRVRSAGARSARRSSDGHRPPSRPGYGQEMGPDLGDPLLQDVRVSTPQTVATLRRLGGRPAAWPCRAAHVDQAVVAELGGMRVAAAMSVSTASILASFPPKGRSCTATPWNRTASLERREATPCVAACRRGPGDLLVGVVEELLHGFPSMVKARFSGRCSLSAGRAQRSSTRAPDLDRVTAEPPHALASARS